MVVSAAAKPVSCVSLQYLSQPCGLRILKTRYLRPPAPDAILSSTDPARSI
jgi:hypothetical protein